MYLDRVEAVLKDGVEQLTVEALLFLQVLLQLDSDGVQALWGGSGVCVIAPSGGQQILHHQCTQALPVCVQPAQA